MKPKNIVKFLLEVGKLKNVKRSGWVALGIKHPESVAEHSFRTAIIVALLSKEFKINREKAVTMALIHDLAEVSIGDINEHHKAARQGKMHRYKKLLDSKYKKEKKTFQELCSIIDNKEFYRLWMEFERGKSKEAKFVRQTEKLEMRLQAMEYRFKHKKDFNEFILSSDEAIKDKRLMELAKEIVKMR